MSCDSGNLNISLFYKFICLLRCNGHNALYCNVFAILYFNSQFDILLLIFKQLSTQ